MHVGKWKPTITFYLGYLFVKDSDDVVLDLLAKMWLVFLPVEAEYDGAFDIAGWFCEYLQLLDGL